MDAISASIFVSNAMFQISADKRIGSMLLQRLIAAMIIEKIIRQTDAQDASCLIVAYSASLPSLLPFTIPMIPSTRPAILQIIEKIGERIQKRSMLLSHKNHQSHALGMALGAISGSS